MRKTVLTITAVCFLAGCMSDREYALRSRQLKNQAGHPPTFDVLSVEGPVKIELGEGGKARVTAPNQPFKEIQIPDGVRTQADLVKYLIGVGAITIIGWKALDDVGGNTTINNAAATP